MARRIRSPRLETRTSRLKLAIRRKPYFVSLGGGVALGYRRCQGPGTWSLRRADGAGGNWLRAIGSADDYQDADGTNALSYGQAIDRARELAGQGSSPTAPITVAMALSAYAADLRSRRAAPGNATRLAHHLADSGLLDRPVSLLTPRELRLWRDRMVESGSSSANADRTARVLKAALNLVAGDANLPSTAWRVGLKRLPGSGNSRDAFINDDEVRKLIAAAHEIDPSFGLLIEVSACLGTRFSQIARCVVSDLQNGGAPRLMVPASHKGRGRKVERKGLPIPAALAAKLSAAAAGRPSGAPLLTQGDGTPWARIDVVLFRRACAMAGLDTALTPYVLRHASIIRQLVAGTPTRVTAALHDTSVMMLEQVYSRHIIGDPSDTLVRRALLDAEAPATTDNVIPIGTNA